MDASTAKAESVAAKAKAKAKEKAGSKAKAKASEPKKATEPQRASLEEALEAANKCSKCRVTKALVKGCRSCMGEWFEEIRQKAFPRHH